MQLFFLPVLQKQRPTPEVHWPVAYNWDRVKEGTVARVQEQCFYKPGREVLCQENDSDLQTKIKSTLKYLAIKYFLEKHSFTPFIN